MGRERERSGKGKREDRKILGMQGERKYRKRRGLKIAGLYGEDLLREGKSNSSAGQFKGENRVCLPYLVTGRDRRMPGEPGGQVLVLRQDLSCMAEKRSPLFILQVSCPQATADCSATAFHLAILPY